LCVYYFFLAVVVIRYETKATARWALLFIVRAFFNDTITVAVWTGFHVRLLEMLPCFANPAVKEKASPGCKTETRTPQAPEVEPWFWTITARVPQKLTERGYAATRADAMADFKAQWNGVT
jgi:hypothetical protein